MKIKHLLLVLSILLTGISAEAKPEKAHKATGKSSSSIEKHEEKADQRFNSDVRNLILAYLTQNYPTPNDHSGKSCPPGLAKKNPACMPPGQYKKYALGQPIGDLKWNKLPNDLLRQLPAAPHNTYYGMVDGDVLLISALTGIVLDAVTR